MERKTYDQKSLYEYDPDVPLYEESKDELVHLPQTTLVNEIQLDGYMPNIYSISRNAPPQIWIQDKGLILPLYVKSTKADVGGVGGHVEVSKRTQAEVLDYVLRHNRFRNRAVFRSVIATHTGDDVCITGVIDEKGMEHQEVVDELLWDALKQGEKVAIEEGLYGPGQDLKADAFTGNIHGLGPASITLPLPFRERNFSQTVLLATADKTEPGAYNYITTGAYLNPEYNTGLLIAESRMSKGYIFEIVDVDTKAQAYEAGVSPADSKGLEGVMEELGKSDRFIQLSGPENLYDICALTMASSRYVIAKIFTKNDHGEKDQLGLVVSAERLHNIKTAKGFTYGGKDDPVMLALCQGDWPAPGEIVSPIARTPLVAGDCRGSHYLYVYPVPINEQTSYWSGPIMSVLTMSINLETGRIGAISDQFAKGTPWDAYRHQAALKMAEFRAAHGYKQPATLPTDEIEYQPGFNARIARLHNSFQRRSV